jgi:hypothetical protein
VSQQFDVKGGRRLPPFAIQVRDQEFRLRHGNQKEERGSRIGSSNFAVLQFLCKPSAALPGCVAEATLLSREKSAQSAEVAELADARGSGPRSRKGVGVRVPSSAPSLLKSCRVYDFRRAFCFVPFLCLSNKAICSTAACVTQTLLKVPLSRLRASMPCAGFSFASAAASKTLSLEPRISLRGSMNLFEIGGDHIEQFFSCSSTVSVIARVQQIIFHVLLDNLRHEGVHRSTSRSAMRQSRALSAGEHTTHRLHRSYLQSSAGKCGDSCDYYTLCSELDEIS